MNIRTTLLGCAAAVASTMAFAVPALADSDYYRTNPTASERDATDALNAEAAAQARGDGDSNDARNEEYRAAHARYTHDRGVNDAERAAYDRDRARYDNDERDSYYRGGSRYGGYYDHDGPVGVSFDFGNIAIGYQDGYWDSGRNWHRWSNDGEARAYRHRYHDHYHAWHHDRDGNDGWIAR